MLCRILSISSWTLVKLLNFPQREINLSEDELHFCFHFRIALILKGIVFIAIIHLSLHEWPLDSAEANAIVLDWNEPVDCFFLLKFEYSLINRACSIFLALWDSEVFTCIFLLVEKDMSIVTDLPLEMLFVYGARLLFSCHCFFYHYKTELYKWFNINLLSLENVNEWEYCHRLLIIFRSSH